MAIDMGECNKHAAACYWADSLLNWAQDHRDSFRSQSEFFLATASIDRALVVAKKLARQAAQEAFSD